MVVERHDAVMLGMGPGGKVAAGRLLKAGKKVAVVKTREGTSVSRPTGNGGSWWGLGQ